MKKITFSFLLIFFIFKINAQVSAYTFSQSPGTYKKITTGTVLGIIRNEDQRFVNPANLAGNSLDEGPGFPIGFDFTFNGIVFDRVGISTNGWISLGQSSLTPSVDMTSSLGTGFDSALSSTYVSTPPYLRNRIAAFHHDLSGVADQLNPDRSSNLRIATIGTAPNRSFVVQWSNYKFYGYTTGCDFSFQIILHETTNVVDVVYGFMLFTYSSSSVKVGLGGNDSTDFNTRRTFLVNDWNKTVAGKSNNDTCGTSENVTPPTPGTTFSWTPSTTLSKPAFNLAELAVYPNPVKNTLNLSYQDKIDNIKIFNVLGQEILNKNISASNDTVDMSQMLPGTYIAKISANNIVQTFKIVKI
ncbi:T9SS type A sorting domain-containing protein [Flavobacterium johnsoniae]|jgi:hypothetical protein|uniref:Secretion system C-terminal sorting domain-containing protein n=1 Tax=Flavobacterium johnsoniae (strain ATCC 17061 / DSM 2064 / JCM 8514 / BCRC 14874 / CCUG 350202 / NBRC 14942 / NCIMB 11054 / UW101) TaxID=376686 RepID=A5FHZ4_FLAJ1|nr:T9SS type A sorting domain-containing protein [Flavobacterium johnsoniae]ABQ05178.1 hypothetical protein Fjoh_2150 [Flavobacterium johnsoniae UW101]OXG00203.1 T9SS C-terminal target domain-containing protein [Flavobacterium johnsoniae UW101]WQG83019.1 T9SS type A sorting domain-containing protein [Flavobacterium johnsoniae UW101]SHL64871.1 Por secretion system C-terminal sorting domain-containing protein [Flavobacterium johnsoniae]